MAYKNNKVVTLLIMLGIVIVLGMVVNALMFHNASNSDNIILGEELTQEQMDSIPTVGNTIKVNIGNETSNQKNYDDILIKLPEPESNDLQLFTENVIIYSKKSGVNYIEIFVYELENHPQNVAIFDFEFTDNESMTNNRTFIRIATEDDIEYYINYFEFVHYVEMT